MTVLRDTLIVKSKLEVFTLVTHVRRGRSAHSPRHAERNIASVAIDTGVARSIPDGSAFAAGDWHGGEACRIYRA